MATRGVLQLSELRLVYCEHGGSSAPLRDFIRSGKIVEWARQHPTVDVQVKVRNGKHPYVQGHYVTGKPQQVCVKNESSAQIQKVVDKLRNRSGRKITKLGKPIKTATPSVQGVWTPMLNLNDTPFKVEIVKP